MKNIGKKNVRENVLNKYNGRCAYCGCELTINNLYIDHFVPKRRSKYKLDPNLVKGTDEFDNYMPSCSSCNSSKSDKTIEEFRIALENKLNATIKTSSQLRILIRYGLVELVDTNVLFHFEKHPL